MKIFIATPCYNSQVHAEMVQSLLQIQNVHFDWYTTSSSILSFNRNKSVKKFLESGYEWLMFWDADISIDSTYGFYIQDMINFAYKKECKIVGIPCRLKVKEEVYNCQIEKENITELPIEPFKVRVIGTGIMLIHCSVFETLEAPWFQFVDTKEGFYPEDWNFCEKCATITPIYAYPLPVKHFGLTSYENYRNPSL